MATRALTFHPISTFKTADFTCLDSPPHVWWPRALIPHPSLPTAKMIQVISEADLTIERAHVSTDGRWFHDSILVQDPLTKGYIKDRQKRRAVESMLHVSTGPQRTDT